MVVLVVAAAVLLTGHGIGDAQLKITGPPPMTTAWSPSSPKS
jgi:hypothetical protein